MANVATKPEINMKRWRKASECLGSRDLPKDAKGLSAGKS
jgi:hypothetical protein